MSNLPECIVADLNNNANYTMEVDWTTSSRTLSSTVPNLPGSQSSFSNCDSDYDSDHNNFPYTGFKRKQPEDEVQILKVKRLRLQHENISHPVRTPTAGPSTSGPLKLGPSTSGLSTSVFSSMTSGPATSINSITDSSAGLFTELVAPIADLRNWNKRKTCDSDLLHPDTKRVKFDYGNEMSFF